MCVCLLFFTSLRPVRPGTAPPATPPDIQHLSYSSGFDSSVDSLFLFFSAWLVTWVFLPLRSVHEKVFLILPRS